MKKRPSNFNDYICVCIFQIKYVHRLSDPQQSYHKNDLEQQKESITNIHICAQSNRTHFFIRYSNSMCVFRISEFDIYISETCKAMHVVCFLVSNFYLQKKRFRHVHTHRETYVCVYVIAAVRPAKDVIILSADKRHFYFLPQFFRLLRCRLVLWC